MPLSQDGEVGVYSRVVIDERDWAYRVGKVGR